MDCEILREVFEDTTIASEHKFFWKVIEERTASMGVTVEEWCEGMGKRAYRNYLRWKSGGNLDEEEIEVNVKGV